MGTAEHKEQQFHQGIIFEIGGVTFHPDGVILNKKFPLVRWEDLGSRSYMTYYSMFSKIKPDNYATFGYVDHWNVGILYSVSRAILREKGLWSE